MTWYKFNGLFYNSLFSFLVPQRKIGTTFQYKGKKYLVTESPKEEIGCTCKDPITGHPNQFCVFCDKCNSIPVLKRGFCAYWDRKDHTSVSFKEI